MGQFGSKVIDFFNFKRNEPTRVLMLGLDAAGKTTILFQMKLQEHIMTIPTIGFNVEEIKLPNTNTTFVVWDIGGQKRLRNLWRHYFNNTSGLMFVIDSADTERISEAAEELENVLGDSEMRGVPLVVLANKQDLPDAISEDVLAARINLQQFKNSGHDCYIQGTVAATGEGLLEGFKNMAEMSKAFMKNKNN